VERRALEISDDSTMLTMNTAAILMPSGRSIMLVMLV
jgi:hypothetical protein